ncbi:MAG: AEC family transporter [Gammaproteobacteria bacterium]|nr:AEC family transporter [Gammaproteobacteria bacterium]
MSNIAAILSALLPLFALILIGTALRRANFPGDAFWPALERLIYFVFFPALLISSLGNAALDATRLLPLFLALLLALAAGSALVFALSPLLKLTGPALSSVYQGSLRFNSYLGIVIVLNVMGPAAMPTAALVIALFIPLLNVACVLVLTRCADRHATPGAVTKSLISNPLILGCLIGLALNLTGLGVPALADRLLSILASAAVPLGLMSVGAGLQFRRLRQDMAPILSSSLIKLLILPLVGWGIALVMGLQPLETEMLVLFLALPAATSAYILARQLGGDHTLVSGLLTFQTALAAITLPLILAFLSSN